MSEQEALAKLLRKLAGGNAMPRLIKEGYPRRAMREAADLIESQQQRIRGVEEENRVLYRRSEIYRKAWHEAQAETAAREAVIAKVRKAVDGPHPANSGLDSFTLAHISAQFDAAPETVLAEVKAQALEEFAKLQDDITRAHDYAMDEDDWDEHRRVTASLRAGAARYRNGVTHE